MCGIETLRIKRFYYQIITQRWFMREICTHNYCRHKNNLLFFCSKLKTLIESNQRSIYQSIYTFCIFRSPNKGLYFFCAKNYKSFFQREKTTPNRKTSEMVAGSRIRFILSDLMRPLVKKKKMIMIKENVRRGSLNIYKDSPMISC